MVSNTSDSAPEVLNREPEASDLEPEAPGRKLDVPDDEPGASGGEPGASDGEHDPAPRDSHDTYYFTCAVIWGDAEQLAIVAAKPATWFPSWPFPSREEVSARTVGDGYVAFQTRTRPTPHEWIEDRCLKEKYNRLYWLVYTGYAPNNQLAYALRGGATDSWMEGFERLPPLQHKLELLHLILATRGKVLGGALRGIENALRVSLAAEPDWDAVLDDDLARGCDLRAAV